MKFLNFILLSLIIALFAFNSNAYETINLDTKNTVTIRSAITLESVSQALSQLHELDKLRDKKTYPLFLVMISPGGDVIQGNSLIALASTIKNLHTICLQCASMAFYIQQSIPGVRYVTPNNMLMTHEIKGYLQGWYDMYKLKKIYKLLETLSLPLEHKACERIKISHAEYKRRIKDEWYTYGIQSVAQNLADRIVNLTCSKALQTKEDLQFNRFGHTKTPRCPIIQKIKKVKKQTKK